MLISIYNIAKTSCCHDEVRRWLKDLGAEGYTLDVTEPAALIALAAKRCYMSFEVGLNPNVTKVRSDIVSYFDNILASGHGCYDSETEVLTSNGWIPFEEADLSYLYASLNLDGTFDYAPATGVLHKPYTGSMYRVQGDVDLLVTPKHRMYANVMTTKEGRKKTNFSLYYADALGSKHYCCLKNGIFKNDSTDGTYDEGALLGFSIGDGTLRGGKIEYHLRRERKIIWLESLCNRNGWRLEYGRNDKYIVTPPPIDLCIYDDNKEKIIPPYLHKSSLYQKGLFDGLIASDGSIGETCVTFHTTSDTLGDQFQQLCLHVGLAANKGKTYEGWERDSYGDKPLTTWYVIRRNLMPSVNKSSGETYSSWIPDWSGDIHCVELASGPGILYVRRNGKAVWCGNSVLEHSTYTFAIEGCSRVFTAEMNRHRAGWAISEGSLRFIRFDKEIPYWVPDSIIGPEVGGTYEEDIGYAVKGEALPDLSAMLKHYGLDARKQFTREVFLDVFEHVRQAYAKLVQAWDMDSSEADFSYKKKVTSCLRRIVPLGVATGGVWTGNIRALRHVLAMRCSPAAEEEICHVFSRIAEMIVTTEPLLFGDFTFEDYWSPKYPKV